ncbi:MAG: hypothetical protein KC543_17920, partial [Myxococcales bacterium]|nr:hypothetical protein [Myxococcales bacterium]
GAAGGGVSGGADAGVPGRVGDASAADAGPADAGPPSGDSDAGTAPAAEAARADAAAKAFAEHVIAQMNEAPSPDEVLSEYGLSGNHGSSSNELFSVRGRMHDEVTESGIGDSAVRTAVFDADQTGPIPHPVETTSGWAAIWVVGIEPAHDQTLAEVHDEISRALQTEAMRKWLGAETDRLRRSTKVVRNQDAIDALAKMHWQEPATGGASVQ